jgi:hypothetical protein
MLVSPSFLETMLSGLGADLCEDTVPHILSVCRVPGGTHSPHHPTLEEIKTIGDMQPRTPADNNRIGRTALIQVKLLCGTRLGDLYRQGAAMECPLLSKSPRNGFGDMFVIPRPVVSALSDFIPKRLALRR